VLELQACTTTPSHLGSVFEKGAKAIQGKMKDSLSNK
jgi:hypothetical protein